MFARQFLKTNFKSINRLNSLRFNSTYKLNTNSVVSSYSANPKLLFTKEHEWISIHNDGTAFIGITNYASDALGDATFVELPSHDIGSSISSGETISSIESVKSASDIYSPIDCEIVDVNESLDESPNLINSDPMGDGWIVKVKVAEDYAADELLNESDYEAFIKEHEDH